MSRSEADAFTVVEGPQGTRPKISVRIIRAPSKCTIVS